MEIRKEIKELKKQMDSLKKDRDISAVDKLIKWIKVKIEKREKNLFWKTFFISVIYHTAIPMFVFLIGITIGVFLGLK